MADPSISSLGHPITPLESMETPSPEAPPVGTGLEGKAATILKGLLDEADENSGLFGSNATGTFVQAQGGRERSLSIIGNETQEGVESEQNVSSEVVLNQNSDKKLVNEQRARAVSVSSKAVLSETPEVSKLDSTDSVKNEQGAQEPKETVLSPKASKLRNFFRTSNKTDSVGSELITVVLKGKKGNLVKGNTTEGKSTFGGEVFDFIAKGKAKQIYHDPTNKEGVDLTDKESLFYNTGLKTVLCFANSRSKQAEIESEYQTAMDIKKELKSQGVEGETNIVLDMEKVTGTDKYALRMQGALGDLDKMIHQLTPEQRLKVARDVLNGLRNLHKAGYIHGDLKPDNILLFEDKDGNITARLADLGKTEKCTPEQTIRQKGNPRWGGPEGRVSLKSESWSGGALCTHIFEMMHIEKDAPLQMLVTPENEKSSFLQPKAKSGRIGFVLFLLKNKFCPQVDNNLGIGGKPGEVYKLIRQAGLGLRKQPVDVGEKPDAQATQKEVDYYLQALRNAQSRAGIYDMKARADIQEVLSDLTSADPNARNLDAAIDKMDEVIARLSKK